MSITKKQITVIHTLLNKSGLTDEKDEFVKKYSEGRTFKVSELTFEEANKAIQTLISFTQRNDIFKDIKKKRSKVLYLAVAVGLGKDNGEIDWDRFNAFMTSRSVLKKPLNTYTNGQLNDLITQFELLKKQGKLFATNHKTPEGHGNNTK